MPLPLGSRHHWDSNGKGIVVPQDSYWAHLSLGITSVTVTLWQFPPSLLTLNTLLTLTAWTRITPIWTHAICYQTLRPVTANLDPARSVPPGTYFPENLFPPELFCTENLDPLTKFGPPCHCVSFEQTIIYTWSIHTKEVIHNKFK